MYKVTLYDSDTPAVFSDTFTMYCDDIEEFEKEWIKLENDESCIERFRQSKRGEMVTDHYCNSPELNCY